MEAKKEHWINEKWDYRKLCAQIQMLVLFGRASRYSCPPSHFSSLEEDFLLLFHLLICYRSVKVVGLFLDFSSMVSISFRFSNLNGYSFKNY